MDLGTILGRIPEITGLVIHFTGPYRWIVPSSSSPSAALLPTLKRLLVADVPSSWDATWPRLLLEAAPSLETLHVHIAPCEMELDEEIHWPPMKVDLHRHLNEFVLAGFQGAARQILLVKFVVGACTALRRVAMFKNGYPQYKGRWDWEMATRQHSWTQEEKESTVKQIMDGLLPSSNIAPLLAQLVLA